MSNLWLRLWHDMPNDPKFKTISRISGRPLSEVITVYVHLMVGASTAEIRGDISNLAPDDIASATELSDEAVEEILSAMQGKVIENGRLSGWEKRQPEQDTSRRDNKPAAMSAAERKRKERERKKNSALNVTPETKHVTCHESFMNASSTHHAAISKKSSENTLQSIENKENVTTCHELCLDTDKDAYTEKNTDNIPPYPPKGEIEETDASVLATKAPRKRKHSAKKTGEIAVELPVWLSSADWHDYVEHRKQLKRPLTPLAAKRAITNLERLMIEGNTPSEVINQSICNGWLGLFSVRKQKSFDPITKNGLYNTPHQRMLANNQKAAKAFEEMMREKQA